MFQHLLDKPAADPGLWHLDPRVIFLNHGSFGACPQTVLACQQAMRERMERQPVQFLVREMESLLDEARGALAQFAGADANNLVFVPNATAGVNTVLRSLQFNAGDELLVTNQEYNACRNALEFAAQRSGARVVVAKVPFPFHSIDEIITAVLQCVTPKTRLALLDHVVSQTGTVMPIARLVAELKKLGVDTLVDGAHAPGMVPLELEKLGAAYYTGNCHKWLCTPKGVALFYVRPDRQELIRPLVISHGANSRRTDRSRFLIEFGWAGTWDPAAYLTVPEALRYVGSILPGGWPEIMARNRALALAARKIICAALNVAEPCPAEAVGSMATIPLPDAAAGELPVPPIFEYPLQDRLRVQHGIEVPIMPWPSPPNRLVRISAQLYNSLPQYESLAKALVQELK